MPTHILKSTQLLILFLLLFLLACNSNNPSEDANALSEPTASPSSSSTSSSTSTSTLAPPTETPRATSEPSRTSTSTSIPASPTVTLAPSATATASVTPWPTMAKGPTPTFVPGWYTVVSGDTPLGIAIEHDIALDQFLELNNSDETMRLDIGDILAVWRPINTELPSSYLIHDSEVVYHPIYLEWDTEAFIKEQGGFLAQYEEDEKSGGEIIDELALKYHIGPRVLLATMEFISGSLTKKEPTTSFFGHPISSKLTAQASWAAEELLNGYYTQLEGRRDWVILSSGRTVRLAAGTNPGSAAVIQLLAKVTKPASDVALILEEERFQKTYEELFGVIDGGAVLPPDGKQPYFSMPFTDGERWAYSGGPHGGYFDYFSAWAALDFAPPLKNGCKFSPYRLFAIAPGLVVESDEGITWIDMDEDGNIHTGWSLLYMHIGSKERIQKGQRVEAGDFLGYPSCEGGVSSASHVHIARMYNGQWMPADRPIPFQLGDWVAQARLNNVYRGYLLNQKTDKRLESSFAREPDKNIFPGDQPIPPTPEP